jgi:hypothetical protein
VELDLVFELGSKILEFGKKIALTKIAKFKNLKNQAQIYIWRTYENQYFKSNPCL